MQYKKVIVFKRGGPEVPSVTIMMSHNTIISVSV